MNGKSNEVGIWVDQFLGGIIGHGMFVRSLCPEESPSGFAAKSIRWNQQGDSYFNREDLPLGYCKVKKLGTAFHLFTLGEAAWGAFHKVHILSELAFQPTLAGMIVVVERESVRTWLRRWLHKEASPGTVNFSWFEKQGLPYVIAASGYQGQKAELKQLQTTLRSSSGAPMIPGPSLREGDRLLFDSEHADRVLTALHSVLESGDSLMEDSQLSYSAVSKADELEAALL